MVVSVRSEHSLSRMQWVLVTVFSAILGCFVVSCILTFGGFFKSPYADALGISEGTRFAVFLTVSSFAVGGLLGTVLLGALHTVMQIVSTHWYYWMNVPAGVVLGFLLGVIMNLLGGFSPNQLPWHDIQIMPIYGGSIAIFWILLHKKAVQLNHQSS